MKPRHDWKFAVEVHPAEWRFPVEQTWIAGWIRGSAKNFVTDLRAWIDHRPFLGLHGLPRPEIEAQFPQKSGPPYTGFSFLLSPHPAARLLRLEACDLEGNWTEFFRTPITGTPGKIVPRPPVALADKLPELLPVLLRETIRRPDRSMRDIANHALSALLAEPLNAFPNPPFVGALEEPTFTGRVRDGRVSVTGWLAHPTTTISRLTAMVDPLQEIVLSRGSARPDISGEFPHLHAHGAATFLGQVDLPTRINAPVLLKIFAELANGEKHLVFAQRFHPEHFAGGVRSLPIVSAFRFARAGWALAGAAKYLGMNTAGVWTTTRAAWAAYPAKHTGLHFAQPTAPGAPAPMRILAVTHNLNFEGAPRLLLELCAFISRQPGVSVQLLSPREGPLRSLYEAAGINVTVLDLEPAFAAGSVASFQTALKEAAKPLDWSSIDLVLGNTLISFWSVQLARHTGKPSVLYVHESAPIPRLFSSLVDPAIFPLIEESVRAATRVVFTADASRQIFHSLARGQCRVLPSWLDITSIRAFAATHDKATLRQQHGYDPEAIQILNLGTVCERKGQHTFIHAATLLEAELQETYPGRKIEFLMVGAREDAFLAAMKSLVADAGLQHVHFVPETRENFAFHRMADILVCTSFEESSPRVLLEAAAFGTPIVSTDVNGIPEMLTGREAWLVEAGDRYHLAAALRQALEAHFAGDTSRAKRAQDVVSRRYDEQVSLPRHLALLREAAPLSKS